MSYILDALKKADRERSLTKAPTLTTVHVPLLKPRPRIVLWVMAGAVLVGGGVALWMARPSPPVVPVPEAVSGTDGGAAVPVRVPESPPQAAPEPSVAALPNSSPVLRPPGPPVKSVSARKLPAPPTVLERPPLRPSGSRAPAPDAIPVEQGRAIPDAVTPTMPALPARPEPDPNKSAGRPGAPAPPVPAGDAAMLRMALAKMTLDVFVYTDVEADRLVVINGRRYTKGQYVDGLYLVENITSEGVVLTYQEERAVLRP